MKKNKVWAVVALVGLMTVGCAPKQVVEEVEVLVPVETLHVKKQEIKNEMVYSGQVKPAESVAVTGKMSGKVKNVYFEVGDRVKQGDVLYRLDEKDIQNQIKQLQSQLKVTDQSVKSAQNALTSVTGGQYESTVAQLENAVAETNRQVENAQIALDNAKTAHENISGTYEKMKTLYEAGTISKVEYDNTELSYKQSQASVERAELGLSTAKAAAQQAETNKNLSTGKITEENLQRAQIGVGQASASRESVQVQIGIAKSTLEDTSVKSPITGVIATKQVKEGEMTSPQVPGYTVVNMDYVLINVQVSELLINTLSVGTPVDVTIGAIGAEKFTGTISSISPTADMSSTYPIEIRIENPTGMIKPGMFANVNFLRESNQNAIVLPRNTVLEDTVDQYVYINDNGMAKKVVVTTGIDNGKDIEILTGLSEADEVIVKGQTMVGEGDKLNIVNKEEVKKGA